MPYHINDISHQDISYGHDAFRSSYMDDITVQKWHEGSILTSVIINHIGCHNMDHAIADWSYSLDGVWKKYKQRLLEGLFNHRKAQLLYLRHSVMTVLCLVK